MGMSWLMYAHIPRISFRHGDSQSPIFMVWFPKMAFCYANHYFLHLILPVESL